ncbi:MAG TPA: hypothetical protein VF698_19280 [Thermoanaerobaculia bacterium]|jgi:hypothetical protein
MTGDDLQRRYYERMIAAAGAVRIAALLAALWFATQIVNWVAGWFAQVAR